LAGSVRSPDVAGAVFGTLGNAPRAGGRGSLPWPSSAPAPDDDPADPDEPGDPDELEDPDEPDDPEDPDAEAGVSPLDRRGSRCGPGQSQIDRCGSAVAGPAPAYAGVIPGSGPVNGGGADGSDDGVGAEPAAMPGVSVISGSSSSLSSASAPFTRSMTSPSSLPGEASVGLPSWPR
jgi:hypothetical protein